MRGLDPIHSDVRVFLHFTVHSKDRKTEDVRIPTPTSRCTEERGAL